MSTREDRQSLGNTAHLQSTAADEGSALPLAGLRLPTRGSTDADSREQERVRRWAERARARADAALQAGRTGGNRGHR